MTEPILRSQNKAMIRRALECSWSKETSVCFDPKSFPLSYGQCAQTAIVLFETFGGEILKTEVGKHDGTSIPHFYNRIDGERHDFTSDQFDDSTYWRELVYCDISSCVEEASKQLLPNQLNAMKTAFEKALEQENDG